MAFESPLRKLQEQAEAEFLFYGPLGEDGEEWYEHHPRKLALVATYGELEAEYAAIRKTAGLIELPHRGTIRVSGRDRLNFLDRMLTNRIEGLEPGHSVRSFWLNRQGRIQADITAVEQPDYMNLDLDIFMTRATIRSLEHFLFSEEVVFDDATERFHRLALHGPRALEILRLAVGGQGADQLPELAPGRGTTVEVRGHQIIVDRRDSTGEIGLELLCPVDAVLVVHEHILETGLPHGLRSIGWLAYNMARIEAGRPIFHVDFGTDTLPHETGAVLREAVLLTKGCYLGQEVVARMESRGAPKKKLVGLKLEGEGVPITGAPVFDSADPRGEVIGAVTSAAPSPMLGNTVIAFAMLKTASSEPGTAVLVHAEGRQVAAEVHDLVFWSRPAV